MSRGVTTYPYKAIGWDSFGSMSVALFRKRERAVATCKRMSAKGATVSLFKVYTGQPGFTKCTLTDSVKRRFFTIGCYAGGKLVRPPLLAARGRPA